MAKTILLADDSVTVRKVVELTFSDSDIRVEAVGSGSEALERLETLQPDLVLADVVMPEPSGYDLCKAVKRSPHPVPVLLLAGTFEPFDPQQAEACGADGHLVKPFESRTLVERVEALLTAGSSPVVEVTDGAGQPAEAEAVLEDLVAAEEEAAEPAVAGELSAEDGERVVVRVPSEFADTDTGEAEPPQPWAAGAAPLSAEQLDAVARAVVARLSAEVVREIAWEVVPDLAEALIRERLRQLEKDATD